MIKHQFSKRFKKNTDIQFKQAEFEKAVADYFEAFVQCYPHQILVEPFNDKYEDWVFKFSIEKL